MNIDNPYWFAPLIKAAQFAREKHRHQLYGFEPYINHLDQVATVAFDNNLNSTIVTAAWLHDILEDTNTTFEELWEEFGWRVAQLVFLVTDESGTNRKERKQKTYSKIKSSTDAILLKLCDRIANCNASKINNKKLFEMYKKEHYDFLTGLGLIDVQSNEIKNLVNQLNGILK